MSMHFSKVYKAGGKNHLKVLERIILKAQTKPEQFLLSPIREEDILIHGASGTVLRKVLPHLWGKLHLD